MDTINSDCTEKLGITFNNTTKNEVKIIFLRTQKLKHCFFVFFKLKHCFFFLEQKTTSP